MKRREFLSAGTALGALSFGMHASDALAETGKSDCLYNDLILSPGFYKDEVTLSALNKYGHYIFPVARKNSVEVIDFFMYTCPHCQKMSELDRVSYWEKTFYTDVVRIPVIMDETSDFFAKIYAFLIAVKAKPSIHYELFDAVKERAFKHIDQKEFGQWFFEKGYVKSIDAFIKILNDFSVNAIYNRYKYLNEHIDIKHTPMYVFDRRIITDPLEAGGYAETAMVQNYIASRLAVEKGLWANKGNDTL